MTQEEISNNGKVVEQQLNMVELPNGIKIPRKQYEQEYATGEARTDMVELPNGIKIPRKQYEEEFLVGQKKGPSKNKKEVISQGVEQTIDIGEVKKGILESKVNTSEKEQQMSDLQKRQRSRALFKRSQPQGLSQQEQRLLEENERQRNQATIDYRNMQDNKRGKSNGIEM